jgi:ribokinase
MPLDLPFIGAMEYGRQDLGLRDPKKLKSLLSVNRDGKRLAQSAFLKQVAEVLAVPTGDALVSYISTVARRMSEIELMVISGTLNLELVDMPSDNSPTGSVPFVELNVTSRRDKVREWLANEASMAARHLGSDTIYRRDVETPILERFDAALNRPTEDDFTRMGVDPGDFEEFIDSAPESTRPEGMPAKVAVLGLAVMDLHFRIPGLPEPGGSRQASEFIMCPGGKGLTQAIACARLEMNAHLLTVIGDPEESNAQEIAALLRKENLPADTPYVEARSGQRTSVTAVLTERDTNISSAIGWKNETNLSIETAKLRTGALADLLRKSDFVFLTFEIHREALIEALRQARRGHATTVVTPAPPYEGAPLPSLDSIDYLVASQIELQAFARMHAIEVDPDVDKLALDVLGYGVGNVVVLEENLCIAYLRRSEEGKSLIDRIPAIPQAGQTKSAGARDAFAAMLAFRLHETAQAGKKDDVDAVKWATAAYSLARRGDLNVPNSMPILEQVRRMMNAPTAPWSTTSEVSLKEETG